MDGFPQVLLIFAGIVVPVNFVLSSWTLFQQYRRGEPWIPYQARETVGWGLLDMGVYVLVFAAVVGLGVKLGADRVGVSDTSQLEQLAPEQQATVMFFYGLATLIATLLCLAWNASRFGSVEGFAPDRLAADIQLGFRWFTILIVPVLCIQLVLNQWFPTKHPLVEMLREQGDSTLLPVAAFVAVFSAPIFEESFFRLFLQGWLEKLRITRFRTDHGLASKADRDAVLLGGRTSSSLVAEPATAVEQDEWHAGETNPAHDGLGANSDAGNPYAVSSRNEFAVALDRAKDKAMDPNNPMPTHTDMPILWNPILCSAGLFAIAHWSHGPDWVALFFLAVGLGYVYQRTGRIVPTMVIHFLVNSIGILQLWVSVTSAN